MSTISTISTSQQSLSMRQIIARQNEERAQLTQEAASGVKQDIYAENAGQGSQSLAMRNRLAETQSFLDSNKLLEGRLEVVSETLGTISEVARGFQDLTLTDSLPSQSPETYRDQARDALERVAAALNTTYGGGYLFSGLSTDRQPVEVDAGGASVSYLGDTGGSLSARIDSTTELDYGIRADDPAFSEIFGALGEVVTADLGSLDASEFDTLLADVSTRMNAGLERLSSMQARHGNNQSLLADKIEENESYVTIYNNTVSDIERAEPEETALRLNELTNQLEVSYQITARISGMSLLDYL